MKAQHEWCGPIAWFLAATLAMLQTGLARADQSVTINRGASYLIEHVDPSVRPEVSDNAHALIVNLQPDGRVLVLGAQAGSATVKVKFEDGKNETYNITVVSVADPKEPLAPGTSPDASSASSSPLDTGSGPAATDKSASPADSSADSTSASAADKPADKTAPVTAADTASTTAASSPATDKTAAPSAPAEKPVGPGASATEASAESASAAAAPSSDVSSSPAASSSSASSAPADVKPADSASAIPPATTPAEGAAITPPAVVNTQSANPAANEPPPVEKYASDPRGSTVDDSTIATDRAHYLPDDAISMMNGTSRLYDFPARIKRISIADSSIADVQVINPHQLMLVGHKPGFTTLAVWQKGKYEERQIRVEQNGQQQVLLNCIVAEVNRQKIENQGINLTLAFPKAGISGVGLPGLVATPYNAQAQLTSSGAGGSSAGGILPPGGNLIPLLLSNSLTYGLSTENNPILTQSFFQYLENHSLGRILAEPRILANSGEEAKFLSGGEIPIVLAQALNTSVVFKQFGTSVTFIPTVVGHHAIELAVRPEVSKPDFSSGVQLFGFTVPAFVTRRAETIVRMNDDQTLVIAGLISTDRQATVNKVPYLGDIPLMGSLFRHTSYQDTKTELVMSVTPQIVTPLPDGSRVAYPEDRPLKSGDIRTSHLNERDVSRPRLW